MIANKRSAYIYNSMFKCFWLFLCSMACVSCYDSEKGGTGSVAGVKVRDAGALDTSESEYELKLLGKYVFFDKISEPERMACVSCHDPETGGTGSVSGVNLHQVAITGANPHTVGNLKPPTNAYASLIEAFDFCDRGAADPQVCGGNFWNGRAEGRSPDIGGALYPAGATDHIGTEVFQGISDSAVLEYAKYFGPTSDQALNPMPNTVEQNISEEDVCIQVAESQYAELYELAWGVPIDCNYDGLGMDNDQPAYISFKRIMLAVGAWQHSKNLNSFSSKRDIALGDELACLAGSADCKPEVLNDEDYQNSPGTFPLVGFTEQENLGHDIFYNFGNPNIATGRCVACHSSTAGTDGTDLEEQYSDNAYHNIGTPANPELPADPNLGLAAHTGIHAPGLFKTPTLRNVDKRTGKGFIKAYAHNGWFKSLESIVHFYNTSALRSTAANFGIIRCPEGVETEAQARALDDDPDIDCWPEPEWPGAARFVVGDLGMTADDEAAVVAYMKTLTDTVTAVAPEPYVADPEPSVLSVPSVAGGRRR